VTSSFLILSAVLDLCARREHDANADREHWTSEAQFADKVVAEAIAQGRLLAASECVRGRSVPPAAYSEDSDT
jgi:hypothetical protein